jgi:formiminoglutamate deiminase
MFQLAERLDPEALYDLSHFAFVELALSGVTAVGEFHYVHHDVAGVPYADRLILSDAVVRAALDAGLRITLLRVLYQRGGYGHSLEPGQRRFVDVNVDDALRDTELSMARYADHPKVNVGLAPHSTRAVGKESIAACVAFADRHRLPFHMHVSEQQRELLECVAEHGRTPIELLADLEALGPRFVGVHATHLRDGEARLLGEAGASVCVCRTTERDLGDGVPDLGAMVQAGIRLTIGTDSHFNSDPFEEARAMELDERSRVTARHAALEAPDLLGALTTNGYAALGLGQEAGDRVVLRDDDPALVGASLSASDPAIDDTVAFHAASRAVRDVWVGGERIVEDGVHPRYQAAREAYLKTLRRVLS